jgi:methylmalonyl-CoA carboxyltransferase large subunit
MNLEPADWRQVLDAVRELRQEVTRLGERVAALENTKSHVAAPTTPGPKTEEAEPLSEELLVVISAAVAAFLGKRPHIRQIRLLGSSAWAQQGRATIQASHTRSPQHR